MEASAELPDLRSAAENLAAKSQTALLSHREQIQKINKQCQENDNVARMLESLPQEGSPKIMVPLGKAAFFPGRLVDTQNCLVKMGAAMYVS